MSNMSMLEAVADPVRLRIIRRLSHGRIASLADLADAAGVHVNTARPRIAELEDAAVIERVTEAPTRRGRPSIGYRLAAGWSVPTSDFGGLAQLLAAVALRAHAREQDLRAVGSEWGRYLQGRPGGHDIDADLPHALEQLGFDARVEDSTLRLESCPCRHVLPDHPELVCELAAAATQGVLDGSGSGLAVGERRHDVEQRTCTITLVGDRAAGAARKRPRNRRR
jgi:predicted ArsR family transcriptional regulator